MKLETNSSPDISITSRLSRLRFVGTVEPLSLAIVDDAAVAALRGVIIADEGLLVIALVTASKVELTDS